MAKLKITLKDTSLDDQMTFVRNAIESKYNPNGSGKTPSDNYTWVERVYEDYAILRRLDGFYKVSYSIDDDMDVIVGDDLIEVEANWTPVPVSISSKQLKAKLKVKDND